MFGKKKLNRLDLTDLQSQVLEALRGGEVESVDIGLTEDDEGDALSVEEIIEIANRPKLASQLTSCSADRMSASNTRRVSSETLRAYALRAEVIFPASKISDGALYYSVSSAHGFCREGDQYVVWGFTPTYSAEKYEEMKAKMQKTLVKRRSMI